MSFLVFGLIAALAGAGALAAGAAVRRRRLPPALPPAEPEETTRESDEPHPELPAFVDHVIQVGDDTRWPRSGIVIKSADVVRAAVLLSDEGDTEQATVALPPPDRKLLWLQRVELALPSPPPTRIEIDGFLLDRRELLPVTLEAVGKPHPRLREGDAMFGHYDGHTGDAAIVLVCRDTTLVWYGPCLEPGEFDCLGRVEKASS